MGSGPRKGKKTKEKREREKEKGQFFFPKVKQLIVPERERKKNKKKDKIWMDTNHCRKFVEKASWKGILGVAKMGNGYI